MPNFMIYVAKAVAEDFKSEPNKSGLVNDLLLRHYGKLESDPVRTHYPERKGVISPGALAGDTAKGSSEKVPEAIKNLPGKASEIKYCKHGMAIGNCKFGCKK